MKIRIARFISILGHPALLMPLAAAIASANTGDRGVLFLSVIIAIAFAVVVFIYTQIKTRAGHWKHVDASVKSERRELNLTASIILFIGAAISALFKVHPGIVAAIGLAGVILIVSHFFSTIAKPSLHIAFAVFAACLTWPNKIAFTALLVSAVFIGWARLCLARHTRLDLAIGAVLGFLAGLSFQIIIFYLKIY